MSDVVLFVSHRARRCGVHEFGKEIFEQISISARFRFLYVECESLEELVEQVRHHSPAAIVFNYHQSTMPWAPAAAIVYADIPSVAIIHDVTDEMADTWSGPLFSRFITHDPDLKTHNKLFTGGPRPLPLHRPRVAPPENGPIRIGSFGFAMPGKGFDELVLAAQDSFDECVIRLHLPPGDFADQQGTMARQIEEHCRSLIHKPGVSLEISHEFLSRDDLLDSLASNHMNALIYNPNRGNGGISSAADLALACGRPLALRRGKMFRCYNGANPSIFVDDLRLDEILANGTAPLEALRVSWTRDALIAVYEETIDGAIDLTEAITATGEHGIALKRARWLEALLADGLAREHAFEIRLNEMHNATISLAEAVNYHRAEIARKHAEQVELNARLVAMHAATLSLAERADGLEAELARRSMPSDLS